MLRYKHTYNVYIFDINGYVCTKGEETLCMVLMILYLVWSCHIFVAMNFYVLTRTCCI